MLTSGDLRYGGDQFRLHLHLYASMKNVQHEENRMREKSRELGRGCLRSLPTKSEAVDPPEMLYEPSLGLGFFSFVKCEACLVFGCEVRAEASPTLPFLRKSVLL